MNVERRGCRWMWMLPCLVVGACSPFAGYSLREDDGGESTMSDARNRFDANLDDAHGARSDAEDTWGLDGGSLDGDVIVPERGISDAVPVRTARVDPEDPHTLDALMFRLTADGGLDTTFDDDGYLVDRQPRSQALHAIAAHSIASEKGYLLFGDGTDGLASRPIEARLGRRLAHGPVDDGFTLGLALPLDTSSTLKRAVDIVGDDGRAFLLANAFPSGSHARWLLKSVAGASYDDGFGRAGAVTIAFGDAPDVVATDLAFAQDGSLLAAGVANGSSVVVHVLRTGDVDQTFGDEAVATAITYPATRSTCITALPNNTGSIVVGSSRVEDRRRIVASHLTGRGGRTLTFAFAHIQVKQSRAEEPSAVAANSDGVYISGHKVIAVDGEYYARPIVVRLTHDGFVDVRFGDGGVFDLTVPDATEYGVARSIALTPNGRVIVGGTVTLSDGRKRMLIARLTNLGTLDETFGDAGIALIDVASHAAELSRFILDDQQRVVGVGWGVPRAPAD